MAQVVVILPHGRKWSIYPAYRQVSKISHAKSQNLNVSHLILQLSLPNPLKPCVVENEDVVGAAPTGDAPTTSEWSTI